ncbi:LysM domain-containing protein [uncultured Desulfosarcina sp.]|uniref:LysM peptidoglycan-binding domain-containing protein n=1 Tax=uncultured Desulfosarcina sp. TaxID=218289 RepID=UPI0029C7E02B|nr:LysM domain-containing protein [uncultured Desulfosarcina sp.]
MNRRTTLAVLFSVFLLPPLLLATTGMAEDKIEVVESETGFYYTIQKGDTLWDLSKRFSDSPWLWPELWENNDQISNPHWIFPGERIRLYQKSGLQTIIETDSVAVTPEEPVKPVKPMVEAGPFFVYSAIDKVGFIRKPPVKPLGTIFEIQGSKIMISEGDIVYIRQEEDSPQGALIPGSRHVIFRYMEPTEERDSMETIGVQHYILGILEVTEKEPDMVIARILKSFRPIKVDDMLMPFSQRHAKVEIKHSASGIDGRIINSEDHTKIMGELMLAFIDKGTADNVEVGQQYSIYDLQKSEPAKDKDRSVSLPPVDFGTILVLHTERTTSTVIVTNANRAIHPGERFRTPVQ